MHRKALLHLPCTTHLPPRLLQCLHRLPFGSASSRSPTRWQSTLVSLLSNLQRVMRLQNFPDTGRADISQAVAKLLLLAVEGPSQNESELQADPIMLTGL